MFNVGDVVYYEDYKSTHYVVGAIFGEYITRLFYKESPNASGITGRWSRGLFTLVKEVDPEEIKKQQLEKVCKKVKEMNERWKAKQESKAPLTITIFDDVDGTIFNRDTTLEEVSRYIYTSTDGRTYTYNPAFVTWRAI